MLHHARVIAAQRKPTPHPCDLYHSALEVHVAHERYVVEMAPVWNDHATNARRLWAVASRVSPCALFRYESPWHNGRIPDIAAAVESPQHLSKDPATGRRVLELVADVPTPTWGRDELHTGEMWNSNSVTAWLLARP